MCQLNIPAQCGLRGNKDNPAIPLLQHLRPHCAGEQETRPQDAPKAPCDSPQGSWRRSERTRRSPHCARAHRHGHTSERATATSCVTPSAVATLAELTTASPPAARISATNLLCDQCIASIAVHVAAYVVDDDPRTALGEFQAMGAPMPRPPPVTMTTSPSNVIAMSDPAPTLLLAPASRVTHPLLNRIGLPHVGQCIRGLHVVPPWRKIGQRFKARFRCGLSPRPVIGQKAMCNFHSPLRRSKRSMNRPTIRSSSPAC